MNLKVILTGIICVMSGVVQANPMEKMQQLPETVVISTEDESLNFKKGTRPDAFHVIEDAQLGDGYQQTYRSDVCFASVTYQPANIGRMSNVKIRRQLKEMTQFQITRQDAYKSGSQQFYMNVGVTPEQSVVLMLSGKGTSFLKIHLSCQTLPGWSTHVNEKAAMGWAQKIADEVVAVFNDPKKDK